MSNTKLGHKGVYELQRLLRNETDSKKVVRGVLKYLDISNNNIGSAGFLKLASRLKKSQTLQCLNISSNNLTEKANQFQQLENLLAKTKSLLNFNLSNCSLQAATIKFLARGMSENSSVVKLILSENS